MINYNFCDLSTLLVGQHWYWIFFGYQIHGQVIITTWVVILVLVVISIIANLKLKLKDPKRLQNLTEYITEFIQDLAKTQVGESDYLFWTPFLGTLFLFIFFSNWVGALVPWKIFKIPPVHIVLCLTATRTTM